MKRVSYILICCLSIMLQAKAQWQDYLFTRHLLSARDIVISPNGQTMAIHDHRSVILFDLESEKRTYVINDFHDIQKKVFINDTTLTVLSVDRLEILTLGKGRHHKMLIADALSFRPNHMTYDAEDKRLCLAGLNGIRTFMWNADGSWQEELDYKPLKIQRSFFMANEHIWTVEAHKKIVKIDKASGARLDSLENEGQSMAPLYFNEARQVLWYTVRMPKGKSRLKLLDVKARKILMNHEFDEQELKKVWNVNGVGMYLRAKKHLYRLSRDGKLVETIRQSSLKQNANMTIDGGIAYYGIGSTGYYGQKRVARVDLETKKTLFPIYPNAEFNKELAVSRKGVLAIDKSDGVTIISPKGKVLVADEMTVQSLRIVYDHNMLFAHKKQYGNGVDSLVRVNLRSGKYKYYPKPLEHVSEFGIREVSPQGNPVKILTPQKKVFLFHPNGKSDSLSAFYFSDFQAPEGIKMNNAEYFYGNMRFYGGGKWLVQDFDKVRKYFVDIYNAANGRRVHRLLNTSYVPSNQLKGPLLYDQGGSMLFNFDIESGDRQDLGKTKEKPGRAILNRSRTKLIYLGENGLKLVNLADGNTVEFKDADGGSFVLSPNEKYLLMTNWGVIDIYDLSNGKKVGGIQTAQSQKDYVIFLEGKYDGTPEGLDLLLLKNPLPQFKRVKGLYRKLLVK